MNLQDYTTEQLKEELKRRTAEAKAKKKQERESSPTCRNCKHYCTVDGYGNKIDPKSIKPWSAHCCPFVTYKNNPQRFRQLNDCHTCEHFDRKQ